jgi:murein L,D-transpeptidase YcbB/YkuD
MSEVLECNRSLKQPVLCLLRYCLGFASSFDVHGMHASPAQHTDTICPQHMGASLPWIQKQIKRLGQFLQYCEAHPTPPVHISPDLKPKAVTAKDLNTIQQLLVYHGDLSPDQNLQHDIDEASIKAGLKRFQERNLLAQTGILDLATRKSLQRSHRELVPKIEKNIRRLSKIKTQADVVFVNTALYKLYVIKDHQEAFDMNVIVGNPENPTPLHSMLWKGIHTHPSWGVPPVLLEKKLKKFATNQQQYSAKGFTVVDKDRTVDPSNLDMISVWNEPHRYRLFQKPGPNNPLGSIKMLSPNAHCIYLHDTPDRALFKRPRRAYSSGCIRLQNAKKLALWGCEQYGFLEETAPTTVKDFSQLLHSKRSHIFHFRHQIPIVLAYITLWVETDGRVWISDDPYGYDRPTTQHNMRSATTTLKKG